MQNRDPRSRIEIPDIRRWYKDAGKGIPFAFEAHRDDRHGQHIKQLLYTTKATLDTNAGAPFYPTFAGRIVGFRANVSGTPVTNPFKVDLLLDGTTVLNGEYVQIAAAALFGYRKPPSDKIYLYPDTKWQWQINTISSATGPAVFVIEYIPA